MASTASTSSTGTSQKYVVVDTVIAEQQVLFNALLAMTSEARRGARTGAGSCAAARARGHLF